MEDALFDLLLFVGFYCLYSKMFAQTTRQAVAVVTPAAVQQTTEAVKTKTAAPAIATVPAKTTTTDSGTVETNTVVESTHNLEPDRDAIAFTLNFAPDPPDRTATGKTAVGFTSTATPARKAKQVTATKRGHTKSRQPGKQTAIASSKGSESRR